MNLKPLDFSNYTFRCSSLGALMTNPKGGGPKEKYLKALIDFDTKESSLREKIADVTGKINDTPEEKQKNKAYTNLKERLVKYESDLQVHLDSKSDLDVLETESKKPFLSETCKKRLIEIYIKAWTGRDNQLVNKYIQKGLAVEEKSISLLSDVYDKYYTKNTERRNNDFIEGECDIEDVVDEDLITDAKSSWDLWTFKKKTIEPLDDAYYAQGQGYMWLWNAKKYRLAYLLINTPDGIIEDECKKILWQMGTNRRESQEYLLACEATKLNLTFDDLSPEEKVIPIEFDYNPEFIEQIKYRVPMWRDWLNEYAKSEFERIENNTPFKFKTEDEEFKPVTESTKEEVKKTASEVLTEAVNQSQISTDEKTEEKINEQTVSIDFQDTVSENDGVEEITIDDDPAFSREEIKSDFVVKQIDIEDSIKEVKAEQSNGSLYESLIKQINSCKSVEDTIDVYKILKPHFEMYPDLKERITDKKASFSPPPAESIPTPAPAPKPTAAPKPVAAPKPQIQPVSIPSEPSVSKADKTKEIEDKLLKCKTGQDVKDLWKANFEFIEANPDLRATVTETGKKRQTNPLP